MEYTLVKWIHILSSTILFGAGVGSAFHLFVASLGRDTAGVAQATRTVVLADWLFTTPTALLQPATGVWLVHLMGVPLTTPWIAASVALYALAMACWLPVLWLQIRLRDVAAQALRDGAPLPRVYWRFFAWWIALGFGGLFSFLAIFWLMVAKRA
jgi:uncharacterized membrane protein